MSIIDYNTTPIILNFNSDERINGSNSSFLSKVENLGIHDYDSIAIIQCSIPRSFYNVPSNSSFTVIQNGISTVCNVAVGSYNKFNLKTVLISSLNTISDGRVYNVNYSTNPDLFKYTFTYTGGVGNVSFVFQNNTLYKQLGFNKNSTNTFVSGSLTSTNCINLSLHNKVFIKSDIVQESNDELLVEILSYGSYPMLSFCYYSPPILESNIKIFNNNNTNSWRFSITDVDGDLVDLNNIPWGVSLMLFKKQNLYDLHKNELNIINQERLYNIELEKEKIMKSIEKKDDDDNDNKKEDISTEGSKVDSTLNENINNDLLLYPYTIVGSSIITDLL
jgi:hypothetical protein